MGACVWLRAVLIDRADEEAVFCERVMGPELELDDPEKWVDMVHSSDAGGVDGVRSEGIKMYDDEDEEVADRTCDDNEGDMHTEDNGGS